MIRRLSHSFAVIVIASIVGNPIAARADPVRHEEWFLESLGIAQAHMYSKGDGVTVAVIDSGVDARHPDLIGNVLEGRDVYPGGAGDGRVDTYGHGTFIAALVAGHGHGNGDGVLGIAPRAKILPVKTSVGPTEVPPAPERGVDYAISHGATVICLASAGMPYAELKRSIDDAERAGAVIVAGAGNSPASTVMWPAAYPGVVAAAAVDRNSVHASVSVTGPEVVLAAPGVNLQSAYPGGTYAHGSGTSGATAIIAGVAALVRAKYPQLSAAEVIHRMTATATDKGPPGRDDEYGYGIVNPVAALTANVPPLSPSAIPTSQSSSVDNPAQALPPGRRGLSRWLVVVVVVLLIIGAVATWLLIQERKREGTDHDDIGEGADPGG